MTVVAIDGPAGAGKSTVARGVAQALGFSYLDTGAMYRGIGLLTLREPDRPAAEVAGGARIELGRRVRLNGEDVTEAIRTPAVSEAASRIAADPAVRAALVDRQREILSRGDWVAEGRDIGTVVAPDATLKVFLTASPAERARRRAVDLRSEDAAGVLADQERRDERDATREQSPLVPAADAVHIDSDGLTAADVVARIVGLLR